MLYVYCTRLDIKWFTPQASEQGGVIYETTLVSILTLPLKAMCQKIAYCKKLFLCNPFSAKM